MNFPFGLLISARALSFPTALISAIAFLTNASASCCVPNSAANATWLTATMKTARLTTVMILFIFSSFCLWLNVDIPGLPHPFERPRMKEYERYLYPAGKGV